MTKRYAAFLRAVNVGGTGKLPMAELRDLCERLGFTAVKTYIASGNVALTSDQDAAGVKALLEAALLDYAGKPVAVMVRDAPQLEAILQANPFADHPGNRVIAMLLDDAPVAADITSPKGRDDEKLELGAREIYVHYPTGMGQSRMQLPLAAHGTARNINTLTKMAALLTA